MSIVEETQIAVWFAKGADTPDTFRAFEAYGHAMTAASAFEMFMSLMVMKAAALRLQKRANTVIRPADRPTLIRSLTKATFANLARRLRDSFNLSAEIERGLSDGKDFRDHLAHEFWVSNAINLHSSEGVDVISEQCALYANHFRLLTVAIVEETGTEVSDFMAMLVDAPNRAEVLDGWKSLTRG